MDSVISGGTAFIETINQRLRMENMKLPTLSREMERYLIGWYGLEVPGEVSPLTSTLNLRGGHDDVRSLFGREPGDWVTFYWYERLRDIQKGINKGRVVIQKGLLIGVDQPTVGGKRADGVTGYTFGSIVDYRDMVDGRVIHWFDVFANKLVVNGIDYTAEHNQIVPVSGLPS